MKSNWKGKNNNKFIFIIGMFNCIKKKKLKFEKLRNEDKQSRKWKLLLLVSLINYWLIAEQKNRVQMKQRTVKFSGETLGNLVEKKTKVKLNETNSIYLFKIFIYLLKDMK